MAGPTVLANYQLGDVLGKGASGQVYRALNFTSGETVAVKQISVSDIPKAELAQIMSEIDLLKNLHHANIVQYKGFVKTRECLYIILEYCENGSLHNFSKRFGKFPENLVAVYISQVLDGLVYLHEQGVIHRDIKGANILTNKDGKVKLADFGVATTPTGNDNKSAVVGSPYWIAPEIIEQLGATTASDIWSVGSVVIELLEGKPPYYDLQPMQAMFRIVQDDCPPIPEGVSPVVKDFLYHCFQKDPNLRISAKKLLRHPWMSAARKQMGTDKVSAEGAYKEAVQKVQEWNEALKSPPRNTGLTSGRRISRMIERSRPDSPTPFRASHESAKAMDSPNQPLKTSVLSSSPAHPPPLSMEKLREGAAVRTPEEETDNWDDDFADDISLTKLQALDKTPLVQTPIAIRPEKPKIDDSDMETIRLSLDNDQTIRPNRSPNSMAQAAAGSAGPQTPLSAPAKLEPIVEDYSDLMDEDEEAQLMEKVAKLKNLNGKGKLIRPDDIRTVGLESPTSVRTAPLLSRTNRPGPSPLLTAFDKSPGHGRSQSFSGSMTTTSISLGRAAGLRSESYRKLQKYSESDVEDYDDVFGKPSASSADAAQETLRLNTRLSNKSWLGDQDSDEEDPFAEIEEDFDEVDLESNLIRDKYARLCAQVNQLIDELVPSAPDAALRDTLDQLLAVTEETPELQAQVVSAHGMLAMLEVLESNPGRDVVRRLLHLVNTIVISDLAVLESFCLIGGIPVVMSFTSKKFSTDCRVEASNFVRSLCNASPMTLQMFISCRGLKVLVDILDEDFTEQQELVVHALNGITSVFELQSPTPKNDFCRMFIREGLLDPLTSALLNIMTSEDEAAAEMTEKILHIIVIFCQASQSDTHVRNALGARSVVRRLLRACQRLDSTDVVPMVKAIKHLSMNATLLDVLHNANTIEVLVNVLDEHGTGDANTEIVNHVFQTCYNLCRLNKSRQEEAATAGIIPHLTRVATSSSPIKQFALPILCDLASAGKSCRKLLWQCDGLETYLQLLADPYFQVTALEAILSWLQDEPARIEEILTRPPSISAILQCFVSAKANSFENLLDPLLKLLRSSTPITLALSTHGPLFGRIVDRLSHTKPVVRLGLLRILRVVCEGMGEPQRREAVERWGVRERVERLSREDGAVLVRELAREIGPVLRSSPTSLSAWNGFPNAGNGRAAEGRDEERRKPLLPRRSVRRAASQTSLATTGTTAAPPVLGTFSTASTTTSHALTPERTFSPPPILQTPKLSAPTTTSRHAPLATPTPLSPRQTPATHIPTPSASSRAISPLLSRSPPPASSSSSLAISPVLSRSPPPGPTPPLVPKGRGRKPQARSGLAGVGFRGPSAGGGFSFEQG